MRAEVCVSDLGRVLARAAIDEAFAGWLQQAPAAALRGYALTEDDRQALQTPGPHWLSLLGKAARELGIGTAAWDPAQAPASSSSPTRPPSPLNGLPDVSVQLRLGPARAPDGRTVWSISLVPPGQSLPPAAPGEQRPWLRVSASDGQIAAWIAPEHPAEGATPDLNGPRWAHRITDHARSLAEHVRTSADPQGAIEVLLEEVTARSPNSQASGTTTAEPLPVPERVDLEVIGLGITGVQQLTRQAEGALRRARTVFTVDASPGVRALLAARCDRVEPLFEQTYRGGEGRLPTYLQIAARVLAASLTEGPVVLAVQGHPTVFSYVPVLLRDVAPLLGLGVRVQPGVSALDALLADLALDPADHGLQCFEATDLLLRRRPIDPHVLTVLWQVGNLETRLHTARPSTPQRLRGLVAWLLHFFPEEHPVTAVALPPHPGVPGRTWTVALRDLPEEAARLHAATTLVLPPIGRRPLRDPWLAHAIDDPAHLEAITAPLPASSSD